MGSINKRKVFDNRFEWKYIEIIENGIINKEFINGFVLLTNKNSKELVGFINEVYNKRNDFGNRLE